MTFRDLSSQPAARMLDADTLPWERQQAETDAAYAAFKKWLDSDKRRVSEHGVSAKNWSSQWSWASRAREYDVYMSRIDLEEQSRYRRRMNERHRRIGSAAQSKVVGWLAGLTDEAVTRMSPADATRLLLAAVQIERAACSDVGLGDMPDSVYDEPVHEEGSLKERLEQGLIEAGLDPDVSLPELARFLHQVDPPAHISEDPPPPTVAVDAGPEPGFDETVTLPDIGIWGDHPLGPNRPHYGGPR